LDCTWKKEGEVENRGSGYPKLALKEHVLDTLKKRQHEHLFREVTPCTSNPQNDYVF